MEWRKKNLTILRLVCEKRFPTRDAESRKERSSCLWYKMRELAGIDPKSLLFMGKMCKIFSRHLVDNNNKRFEYNTITNV